MSANCPTCGQSWHPPVADDLRVDLVNNMVIAKGHAVRVSSRIADLIHIFLQARLDIKSMDDLYRELNGWSREPTNETTIRVFMCRANKALRPLGYNIENIHGRGWWIRALPPVKTRGRRPATTPLLATA